MLYKVVMNLALQSLVSDIAVAIFKVASIISHLGLKSALENQAISLITNPCSSTTAVAINLIILGRETGDIKPINASVLIRELTLLQRELSPSSIATEEIDISSIFTPLEVGTNTSRDILTGFTKSDFVANIPATRSRMWTGASEQTLPKEDRKNRGHNEWQTSLPTSPVVSAKPDGRVPTRPYASAPANTRTDNQSALSKTTRTNIDKKKLFNSDRVYQYMVSRKLAKLKELEVEFPEVSGRTVRRVTESLMREGKIERVGNPGPTSFYRLVITPPATPVITSLAPIIVSESASTLASYPSPTPVIPEPSLPVSASAPTAPSITPLAPSRADETKQWMPVFHNTQANKSTIPQTNQANTSIITPPSPATPADSASVVAPHTPDPTSSVIAL